MASQPNSFEQYFIELVNRERLHPSAAAARYGIDLNQGITGTSISPDPKQPLAFNETLLDAARDHSWWVLATDTFSHTGVNNSRPSDRAQLAGYPSQFVGENISITYGFGVQTSTEIVADQHEGLFLSPGHRANILNEDYQELGIGIVDGLYQGDPATMTTQKFGSRFDNQAFITGVAYNDTDNDEFYTPGEGLGGVNISARRQADNQLFQTTSLDAGGYQLHLGPGTYALTFSGSAIAGTLTYQVVLDDENIKLDVVKTANSSEIIASGQTITQPVNSVTDFDDNGSSDIFIQNQVSGEVGIWLMNGPPHWWLRQGRSAAWLAG